MENSLGPVEIASLVEFAFLVGYFLWEVLKYICNELKGKKKV